GVALRVRGVLGLLRGLLGLLLLRGVLGRHLRGREAGVGGRRGSGRGLRSGSLDVAGRLIARRLVGGRVVGGRLRAVGARRLGGGRVVRRVGDGRADGGRGTERARGRAARDRRGRLELAQLAFDVAAQLLAVLRLEDAQLLDAALERGLLGFEGLDGGTLLVLGLRDEARGRGVPLGDELVAALHALAHVLLVESARE